MGHLPKLSPNCSGQEAYQARENILSKWVLRGDFIPQSRHHVFVGKPGLERAATDRSNERVGDQEAAEPVKL